MSGVKNIVITGSARGLGLVLAREFLAGGCRVMLSGRSRDGLERALESLAPGPGMAFTAVCDVTRTADLEGLWREAAGRFQSVDVWINNAGIGQDWLPVWELPAEAVRNIIATNVTGLIQASQVACRGMRSQGRGQIWNMEGFGSDGRMMDNLTVYGASKCAVRYFTESLAREARGTGVLVGSLQPGMMATEFVLGPLRRDPERLKKSLPIFNILADKPETVARFMVPRILKNKKQGARLTWLSGGKLTLRFLSAPFVKRKVFEVEE